MDVVADWSWERELFCCFGAPASGSQIFGGWFKEPISVTRTFSSFNFAASGLSSLNRSNHHHGDDSTHIAAIELLEDFDTAFKTTEIRICHENIDYISCLQAMEQNDQGGLEATRPNSSPWYAVLLSEIQWLLQLNSHLHLTVNRKIKCVQAPPAIPLKYREPIKRLTEDQISLLDPTGARTNLFSRANPDAAKVGDILLVRLKTGDPFAGVCINIRRRGIDTGILLRNELTRVGVEMWYKIYSPNVEGIEVVQRREKRARRARLTYMRKPKHDMGSVQGIVLAYTRSRQGGAGQRRVHQPKGKGKKKAKK